MGFMYYVILNTLASGGRSPPDPCFRDTIPGLAPPLILDPPLIHKYFYDFLQVFPWKVEID